MMRYFRDDFWQMRKTWIFQRNSQCGNRRVCDPFTQQIDEMANVQPATAAKEERAKLVCPSFIDNVFRRIERPMKHSG
jgi:hypothetical protein